MGSSCARRLRREVLFILGERGSAYKQARRSPRGGGKGGPASQSIPNVCDGEVEHSPLAFIPRAESTISFGGPVTEETSNLCYMFGMANDEGPVEKTLVPLSSTTITFQNNVNSLLVTIMVDSAASGHYFEDVIIRDLKQRLQGCVYLATPRKIFIAVGALLDGTVEGVLQALDIDD